MVRWLQLILATMLVYYKEMQIHGLNFSMIVNNPETLVFGRNQLAVWAHPCLRSSSHSPGYPNYTFATQLPSDHQCSACF